MLSVRMKRYRICPRRMAILLNLLTAAAIPTAEAIGVVSSCAAISNGTAGNVTCTFSVDIEKSKHNFLIQHYDFETPEEPDNVLICTWVYAGLECHVQPTYHFDYKVSSEVTLEIPKQTKKHEGMYMCYVVPSDGEKVDVCELTKFDRWESKRPQSTTTVSTKTELQRFSEDKSQVYILATGLLAGFLLMALLSVLILFCVYRKRNPLCGKTGRLDPRTDSSTVPMV